MDDYKNNDEKGNPFDHFQNEDKFQYIFETMEKMMKKTYLDYNLHAIKPGDSFIQGFNLHIEPDGTPKIQEFSNIPKNESNNDLHLSSKRKSLVDIFEKEETISITIEMTGVKKHNIDLNVDHQTLKININKPIGKYQHIFRLPHHVKDKNFKATYKNDILDIELEKSKTDVVNSFKIRIQ